VGRRFGAGNRTRTLWDGTGWDGALPIRAGTASKYAQPHAFQIPTRPMGQRSTSSIVLPPPTRAAFPVPLLGQVRNGNGNTARSPPSTCVSAGTQCLMLLRDAGQMPLRLMPLCAMVPASGRAENAGGAGAEPPHR